MVGSLDKVPGRDRRESVVGAVKESAAEGQKEQRVLAVLGGEVRPAFKIVLPISKSVICDC